MPTGFINPISRIKETILWTSLLLQSTITFAQGNIDIRGGSVTINAVNNTFITIHNLNLQTGNSLIIDSSTIQIGGTITSTGSFYVSNGTIEENGSGAQTIPGNALVNNALLNLIISNTSLSGVS